MGVRLMSEDYKECPYKDKMADSLDRLSNSVDILNYTLPTLATREDMYEVRDNIQSTRAMAMENISRINKTYWLLTGIMAALGFTIGLIL